MLEKITGKTRGAGQARTHAHYAGEFGSTRKPAQEKQAGPGRPERKVADGSRRMSGENSKDPAYRAARAQHFAEEAQRAHAAHASAKTPEERLKQEAIISHAADRAGVHARFVTKSQPGSQAADEATKHAKIAQHLHQDVQTKKSDAREEVKAQKTDQRDQQNEVRALEVKQRAAEATSSRAVTAESPSSLRDQKITSTANLGGGQNSSQVVTFQDGSKAVYKPSAGELKARTNIDPGTYYRREAAASKIAEHFGMHDMVPETVIREHEGKVGSLQRWKSGSQLLSDAFHGSLDGSIDGGKKFSHEDSEKIRVFDYVVGNSDRHAHNILVGTKADGSPHPILIDHGLSFPKGEPDRFIQPVSAMTNSRELHPNTQKLIDGLDLQHIARSMHESGIEKDAIKHTLMRARALKEDSSIIASPHDQPSHDAWEVMTHGVHHMVSREGKNEVESILSKF